MHGDSEAERFKANPLEFAFYTAVSNNDSAKELMQQELRELAVVLLQRVQRMHLLGLTIKESVKENLKLLLSAHYVNLAIRLI